MFYKSLKNNTGGVGLLVCSLDFKGNSPSDSYRFFTANLVKNLIIDSIRFGLSRGRLATFPGQNTDKHAQDFLADSFSHLLPTPGKVESWRTHGR
jgi:hypothetical protein